MKLFKLLTQAFEQRVKQELEENPALESGKEDKTDYDDDLGPEEFQDEDPGTESIEAEIDVDEYLSDDEVPSYRLQANNYSADDEEKTIPYASGTSFTQYLKTQLSTLRFNETEQEIADFLVGSIDESGYLRRELQDVVDDLAFTQNVYTDEKTVESVLKKVQELDPGGVGARSLQECLLLQLDRKEPTKGVQLATDILDRSFDLFSKKHYKKLLS